MFKKLTEKMGKDKGSILKAKYVDVKKISAQIEEDLKHRAEKEKTRKKTNHRRNESSDKVEVDVKKKSSLFMDETKNNNYNSQLDLEKIHMKVMLLLIKPETLEECHIITDKHILIKEYNTYYFRDFHYFYNTPYTKKPIEITCFNQETLLNSSSKHLTDLLEQDYLDVYSIQLLSIKNLARFDCWEDKPPSEWITLCRENIEKTYDGLSTVFENNGYVLRQVKVLEYDESQMKYKVMFIHSENTKYVSRLSLQFFSENQKEFEFRKDICERRRTHVDEFLMLTRYTDNVPLNKVQQLSNQWEKKIMCYLCFNTKRLASKLNSLFQMARPQMVKQISIVKQDYIRQMKKCRILMEMQEKENQEFKTRNLKLRNYYKAVKTCEKGIIKKQPKSEYIEKKTMIQQKTHFEDSKLIEVLKTFLKECEELKKVRVILSEFEQSKLPYSLEEFKFERDKYNSKSESIVIAFCKFKLKNLIMDKLKEETIPIGHMKVKKYDFFMVEKESYPNSRIKKVLETFNLILQNKVKEMVEISINSFMRLFRTFYPCDHRELYYSESRVPLFTVRLIASVQKKDEKKDKKDKKDKKETLFFEPRLKDFEASLEKSYTHLKVVTNSLQDLMSLSIKIVPLPEKKVFELKDDYEIYKNSLDELKKIFENGKNEAKEIKSRYKQYEWLLSTSEKSYMKKVFGNYEKTDKNEKNIAENIDMNIVREELNKLYLLKNEVISLDNVINLRMFQIQLGDLHKSIKDKIDSLMKDIVDMLRSYSKTRLGELEVDFKSRTEVLNKIPENIQDYDNLNSRLQSTSKFEAELKKELVKVSEIIETMETFYFKADKENDFLRNAYSIPNLVIEAYRSGLQTLDAKKVEFSGKLEERKKELRNNIKVLMNNFEDIKKFDSFDDYKNIYEKNIQKFKERLGQAMEEKAEIKSEMKILNPEKAKAIDEEEEFVEYENLEVINKEFEFYKRIWENYYFIYSSYDNYINKSNLSELAINSNTNTESFQYVTQLEETKQLVEDIAKACPFDPTIVKLTGSFKERIKEYESYNWIVQTLRSSVLKDPDWVEVRNIMKEELEKVNERIQKEIDNNPHGTNLPKLETITLNSTLRQLRDLHIDDFRGDVETVKSKANRRAQFTNDLKNLQSEFNQIKLPVAPKGESKIIRGIDEIQVKLDEQTSKIQNIAGNPVTQSDSKLKFEARNYDNKLKLVQSVLEQIVLFQASFFYLQPIFTGNDNKALPEEQKLFEKINSYWTISILENVIDGELSLAELFDKDQNLLKPLQDNNNLLKTIKKKLEDYLNSKRKLFPRFYFVSDEDLMRILAQSKDPTLVQPHLPKCFEGIYNVNFENGEIITAMKSADGERVELKTHINVNDGIYYIKIDACKDNVEQWLRMLEEEMMKTMEKVTNESLEDYMQKPKRIIWIQSGWPGQVIQIVDQIIWTGNVESAILKAKEGALESYLNDQDKDLKDVVNLIRTDINKAMSLTLSALIVVSVHNKDIVQNLITEKIEAVNAFDWIAQMRYYWGTDPKNKKDTCPLKVKMVNSCLNYGFEYLGNIQRLVITPLTDRCFRTLMGAYQVKYGGAPEGPAGTGKTESVKDLSKTVGVKCNVFNCTEGLNNVAMSKFFRGLASSGCWCCFDEFNRIDLEVLSVIAQQIFTIQQALKAGVTIFTFDSHEIELKDTCAINITMNPSYSGRNDLPDNLKALFRPCAMMVADYYLIAQIKLYSFGFITAKVIANKVVSSLKLSSEQLSTQPHYDFGMRSLNAILVAAGKIKKKIPDDSIEDRIALRALVDVNLPKFTTNDTPLFMGIIGDLFPGTLMLESDLSVLENQVISSCNTLNLQPKPNFIKKCLQLYETLNVRHALMVVGKPGNGKSRVIATLEHSIITLKDRPGFSIVESKILNPKSLSQKQLYGFFDSTQWMKGLLQVKMIELVEKEKGIFKWLIFDGPVDTLWIENMNSLLDDNKKLCLEDSSSIPLGDNMNIIFEVDDLKEASPATISRNGMVLCEQDTIDYEDLLISYTTILPSNFDQKMKKNFLNISQWLIKPLINFLFNNCSFGLPTDKFHLTKAYIDVFECFLKDYRFMDLQKDENTKNDVIQLERVENFILFSALIGFYGPFKKNPKFQDFFYDLILGNDICAKYSMDNGPDWKPRKMTPKLHDFEDIFDYVYNPTKNKWERWNETQVEFKIREDMKFHELVIPTPDTIKINWLINMVVPSKKHFLVTGNTGTGKTLTILNSLNHQYETDKYTYIKLNFTAQTTAELTQSIIEGKMQKSYRKFSPTKSRKGIIFIDDLNMPQKEKFGAQPPIELLRQFMDYGGWYDLISENKDFVKVVDVSFIASMGSVASGRTVSQRYLRHYICLYNDNYTTHTLNKIFSFVMEWYFLTNKNPSLSPKAVLLKDSLIVSSIQLFSMVSSTFKATPQKSHYSFNLRDMSRVFQGITHASALGIKDENDMIKLWIHENERVFKDRLINDTDRIQYDNSITEIMKKHLKRDFNNYIREGSILFGDFVPMLYTDAEHKNALQWQYCELSDKNKLKAELEKLLDEYNREGKSDSSSGNLNLVLFNYAIEHIVRISRIINTPNGHALLVGVGGSGRKSLTTLSSFVYSYSIFPSELSSEFKIKDWKDSLRSLLKDYALAGKQTVYLLSDAQITNELILEDINNLLNNGEIPNLIEVDDFNYIRDTLTSDSALAKKNPSDSEIYQIFVEICKSKIHVVLTFSPIGELFRKRIMMFPSLVNCSTIDWFLPWPEDALHSVAEHYLSKIDLQKELLRPITDICVKMQTTVIEESEKYLKELKKYYYVTPMSFIELLNLFKDLLNNKRNLLNNEINKFTKGLKILQESEELAKNMSTYINETLTPQITKSTKECNEKKKEVSEKTEIAKKKEEEANIAAAKAMEDSKEAGIKNDEAQIKLNSIKKIKDEANEKSENIQATDILQIQKYKFDDTMNEFCRLLCILMLDNPYPKPIKNDNPKDKTVRYDYFKHASTNFLGKPNFLKLFMDRDPTAMKTENADELRKVLEECIVKEMPDKFKQKSTPMFNIYEIIKCKSDIYFINLEYLPTLEKAEKAAESKRISEANLKSIQDELARIKKEKEEAIEESTRLELEIENLKKLFNQCQTRLKNATNLITNLINEKANWAQMKDQYIKDEKNVVGDIFISSGIVAYLGAFTKNYRLEIIKKWSVLIEKNNIPFSSNSDSILQKTLGDKMEIERMKMNKLPNDNYSVDNALIINNSSRWSLMIDPQNQANEWIIETFIQKDKEIQEKILREDRERDFDRKDKKKECSYHIIKPTMENNQILKITSMCIELGYSLLFENVGENLNPILNPVYKKETIKDGNYTVVPITATSRLILDKNFRFYMTTKIPSPHYSPEICVALTLVNFIVTEDGMEDQMINFLVEKEEPDKEMLRKKCIENANRFNIEKKNCEKKILDSLSSADRDTILDNIELINILAESSEQSKAIESSLQQQVKTEEDIKKTRAFYKTVAFFVAQLFFTVADLTNIEPVYQYSLNWYKEIFNMTILHTQNTITEKPKRLEPLKLNFTEFLYNKICMSLFEKDKLVFSFILYTKITQINMKPELIPEYSKEVRFLVTSGTGKETDKPNPANVEKDQIWCSNITWNMICELSELNNYKGLDKNFEKNISSWKKVFNSANPMEEVWPSPFDSFSNFNKVIILKLIRPDKAVLGVKSLITNALGEKYIQSPLLDIVKAFNESKNTTPIFFILSPGADPMVMIENLSKKMGRNFKEDVNSLSLGQGQEKIAQENILNGIEKNKWIILQNCHLAKSFMIILEKLIESIVPDDKSIFRLFLTAMPSTSIPISIIQNSIKLTNEPPRGLKQSIKRSYASFDEKFFENCRTPVDFKRLIYGFCFFHAMILERRKYGALGWNIPYEFSGSDLSISLSQLQMFLDKYDVIQWDALNYMVAEANYGGRVTDPNDRKLISVILKDICNFRILDSSYRFMGVSNYPVPPDGKHEDHVQFIEEISLIDPPSIFGLHNNADITCAINETNNLFNTILLTLSRSSSNKSGKSVEDDVKSRASDILNRIPDLFNVEEVMKLHPIKILESLNSVLHQELMRYNNVLTTVKVSMKKLIDAINGDAVMTSDIENILNSLYNNKIPQNIEKVSYPSLKPLASWINDLLERLKFMQNWIDNGIPNTFWISGFFFTQSFLTGILQNYARKYRKAIDELEYDFEVLTNENDYDMTKKPEDGCYIYGFYIEGGSWNYSSKMLDDPVPKILFPQMPKIWFIPKHGKVIKNNCYYSPVYRTSKRAGELSTTGHSTNFLIIIYLPFDPKLFNKEHWVKRGTAVLCSLND